MSPAPAAVASHLDVMLLLLAVAAGGVDCHNAGSIVSFTAFTITFRHEHAMNAVVSAAMMQQRAGR